MVRRLRMSAADGFLMSRPGVDVTQTNTHRLIDPRFPNLEVHQHGSGFMTRVESGNNRDIWTASFTYPNLGYIPIVMISTTIEDPQDRIYYPASLPARVTWPTPVGTFSYYNHVEIRSTYIFVRAATQIGRASPKVNYTIFKNPRNL